MSMLAFFPWLDLDEDLQLPEFSLIRFRRGAAPGGVIQATLDAVLELYVVGDDEPIRKATLLQLPGRGLVDDLAGEERDEQFQLAELIALAGLAKREFFAPFHYANRDTFQLIIQSFADPAGGVAVRSRRRDGSTNAYKTREAARVRQPDHIAGTDGVRLDVPLLEALLKLRGTDDWADFEEAIFFFSRANTDNNDVFEQAEIISMTSAFERVLGCRSGKERELAERFAEEWRQNRCMLPSSCARIPGGQEQFKGKSVVEVWIRDFFRHRGNVGHGRKRTEHPALWSAEEHLLLGAYAFPLLLKLLLNKRQLYAGSWQEQVDIDVFDELACAQLFGQVREDREDGGEGPLVWPWNEIRSRALLRRSIERAFAVVNLDNEATDGQTGDELIVDAQVVGTALYVVSREPDSYVIRFDDIPALRTLPLEEWSNFTIAEDGSHIDWPSRDIHLDVDALLVPIDPAHTGSAERVKRAYGREYGAAIARLRRERGLQETDIPGLSVNDVRGIESGGEVAPDSLKKLATAHAMTLVEYMNALAKLSFEIMSASAQASEG